MANKSPYKILGLRISTYLYQGKKKFIIGITKALLIVCITSLFFSHAYAQAYSNQNSAVKKSALLNRTTPKPADKNSTTPQLSKKEWRKQMENCLLLSSDAQFAPRISIISSNPDGKFNRERYNVRGSIEGFCLADAGFYEDNERISVIDVTPVRVYRRFNFDVVAHQNKKPEIRAHTVSGERASKLLLEDIEEK